MYKNLINKQIQISINDLWCLPLSIVASNEINKKKCLDVFADDISDDMSDNFNVIYQASDDGLIILGYIEVEEMSITESKYYHALRQRSSIHDKVDPIEDLQNENCVHICKWVFDHKLQNKKVLEIIFTLLFSGTNAIFWCNSTRREEIIYYPVNRSNYRDAAAHLASNFLEE